MTERRSALEVLRAYPGTAALLSTLVLFFALEHALGGTTDPHAAVRLGAMRPDLVAERHEYWRLVMPMFLHHGWAHLLIDLGALAQVAAAVERLWGPRRLALFTVLTGVAASLASASMRPEGYDMALGASGVILGLAGVLLGTSLYGEESLRDELAPIRRRLLLLVTLALGLGWALSWWYPIFDNFGHAGGFVCGMLLAAAQPELGQRTGPATTLASAGAMLVVGASMGATAVWGGRALDTIDIDSARRLANRASEALPGDPSTVLVLAEMADWYEAAGAREEGLDRFGRLVSNLDEPLHAAFLAEQLLTRSAQGEDRDVWADVALARWLELDPDDPSALNALAWHLVTRKVGADPIRAEALSRRSLERLRPGEDDDREERAHYLDTLGKALLLQGEVDEALAVQQESHALATELELDALPEITERLREIESASSDAGGAAPPVPSPKSRG